ncbi:MAG: 3-deoxy-7-phosphoheptulonate synthase [Clostridia bacterium]|nr:3-deoxy-7-phosphoheptulonate synthase [Clostridia bacterium]MDD3832121.1 3-deoxy-7-phosphoheptulonate synthase [Clostridia bacterium]
MIVIFRNIDEQDIDSMTKWLNKQGVSMQIFDNDGTIIGKLYGNIKAIDSRFLYEWKSVINVISTECNHALAGNSKGKRTVTVGNVTFGQEFVMIAGPCTIEQEQDLLTVARAVADSGAKVLRGGAYKPRTSPYSYQGLGSEGLAMLERAGKECGLMTVSEIPDAQLLSQFDHIDILQVGARNMQNYYLLKQLGKCNKPILLKRGLSSTVDEWLYSAEYIMSEGNCNVILCDRGIRMGDRCVVDIAQLYNSLEMTCLPIIVDPSHACGNSNLVLPLSRAVASLAIDGLMIEVNADCQKTLCDGVQSLSITQYQQLVTQVDTIRRVI